MNSDATVFARLRGVSVDQAVALAAQAERRGTLVLTPRHPDYPIVDEVPHRPAVLFVEGERPAVLRAPG